MRPPARTTRSIRPVSDDQDPPSPPRRTSNFKIVSKTASRSSSKAGTPYAEKKPRHRMTDLQLERLEALYQQDTHPTREQKQALGDEVGMDTRTVTVWFQNRRQLQKKQSVILGSTPQPMCRQPLRTSSQINSQTSSRRPSVSSVSQSSAPNTPLFVSPARQLPSRLELWEHMASSPATSAPVSTATSAMPSPLAKKFPKMYNGTSRDGSKENEDPKKRKPILEWACARVAKRQRMQVIDEDDEETEDDSDLDITLVDVESSEGDGKFGKSKLSDVALGKKAAPYVPKANPKIIAIPPEYTKSFDPDVVFGASLLLTLQQSLKSKAAQ